MRTSAGRSCSATCRRSACDTTAGPAGDNIVEGQHAAWLQMFDCSSLSLCWQQLQALHAAGNPGSGEDRRWFNVQCSYKGTCGCYTRDAQYTSTRLHEASELQIGSRQSVADRKTMWVPIVQAAYIFGQAVWDGKWQNGRGVPNRSVDVKLSCVLVSDRLSDLRGARFRICNIA